MIKQPLALQLPVADSTGIGAQATIAAVAPPLEARRLAARHHLAEHSALATHALGLQRQDAGQPGALLLTEQDMDGYDPASDAIDPAGPSEQILVGLDRVASVWNARFARTGTWDLSFEVLPDLEAAAATFWDRYYENYPPEMNGKTLTKQDWMDLCRDVTGDPHAHNFLVESFSQDFF